MTASSSAVDRNVVLTGFMATGKSTIGRLLADRLGFELVDTDDLIEREHGPIADIFADRGEEAFRALEREVAAALADRSRLVISTGGRLMLDPANIAALSRNGRVFCLVASPEAILARLSADESPTERPLLAVDDPRRRIAELLAERAPGYRRFPQIATDVTSLEAVVDDLTELVHAEPERFTMGEVEFVVGVAVLPLVRELAHIDGPVAVVTDAATAGAYLPLLPEPDVVIVDQSPAADIGDSGDIGDVGDVATVLGFGPAEVCETAARIARRSDCDIVLCPTDAAGILHIVSEGFLTGRGPRPAVIVDVATIQALGASRIGADFAELVAEESPDPPPVDTTRPGALGELRSLVTRAIRQAAPGAS